MAARKPVTAPNPRCACGWTVACGPYLGLTGRRELPILAECGRESVAYHDAQGCKIARRGGGWQPLKGEN